METKEGKYFSDQQIFLKIWTQPRSVFEFINKVKHDKYTMILLVLAGISSSLERAISNNFGDRQSLIVILLSVFFGGGILGWITYYIYSALISLTGRLLGGKADTNKILRSMSFALLPLVLMLFINIPQIAYFGMDLFKEASDLPDQSFMESALYFINALLGAVLGVYGIVFFVIAISEAQKFSIWSSLLNILLPIILISIPVFLIALITYS